MSPPPPAEGFASRLFGAPALRTQSDRRLVTLVRSGYETAFEEIVRRYRRPLGRYAGAIVPKHRAEDVTQDAFSKALLALRQGDSEIELRPWLYRIVRNTALNDLRDQPPPAAPLEELAEGGGSAYQEVARREEIADLIDRLRALPEPQRAAIVMRELEGLSHDEIAAALGISGGAARQVIYRARRALRDGVGLLIPLPLVKLLLGGGAVAQAGAAGAGGVAFGGAASSLGGAAGTGVAVKTTAATLLVAGSVGAGVVLQEPDRSADSRGDSATRLDFTTEGSGPPVRAPAALIAADDADDSGDSSSGEGGEDRSEGEDGDRSGRDSGSDHGSNSGPSDSSGPSGSPATSGSGGSGSGHSGSGSSGPSSGIEPEPEIDSSGSSGSGSGSSGLSRSGSGSPQSEDLEPDSSGPGL